MTVLCILDPCRSLTGLYLSVHCFADRCKGSYATKCTRLSAPETPPQVYHCRKLASCAGSAITAHRSKHAHKVTTRTLIPTMAVVYCHMAHMAVVAISRTIAGALRGITHIAVDIILALQHGQAIPSHFLAGKKREGTQWICRALHPR